MGLFSKSTQKSEENDAVLLEDIKRKLRQIDMKIININRRIDRIDADLDSLFEEPTEDTPENDFE